ncbi:hypothetical protein MUK42_32994 [Musa troglodytarum]|uniref:Uncharacterized protein n=1 Tax=Musa troglodytarum TaxID=320322 RepID=A0A9E7JN04_9LILI|nr:hypothetical protein MUK42_32994 [Musa troglodytarum]
MRQQTQAQPQNVQVLAVGRTDRDRPAGAAGEQVGEDCDVLARADGQRREELLEHEAEAAGEDFWHAFASQIQQASLQTARRLFS